MAQSTIALIILMITLIMYMLPRIPVSVTTIFAMVAMASAGIISYQEVFSGFANSATILVAGMMIIGHACFTSGLAEWFGRLLYKFVGANEKLFIVMILVIASALAVVLNGALVVAMLMPIIDSIASQSNGSITRKHCYFPLGVAATVGNNLTTISASSMITAAGLVAAAGYGEISLFAPTLINLPALVTIIAIYILFGYQLQQKWFDFEELPLEFEEIDINQTSCMRKWKMVITAVTLICVVVALIFGVNYGICALVGAAILIFTGCIDEKSAFRSVSWPTVIIVAAAMGFSKGLEVSGAGELMAKTLISLCGPLGGSPFGLCAVLFFIGSLLSNMMSDNASVAILVPITIAMAKELGCDVIPMVLSVCSGIKLAIATPISVATMTMVEPAGYRFKDYVKMGGFLNVIGLLITCVALKIVYY